MAMRILVCFLICAIGCRAQRPEDQVLAVYKEMEKAEQNGDANAWIGLWCRESTPNAEKMRPYVRPRPDVHYTSSRVFVQGDEAALPGQSDIDQFLSMRFVREDGRWKIKDQVFGNTAFHPDSVYAMIPPAAGAFERAGAPWQSAFRRHSMRRMRPGGAGRCGQPTMNRCYMCGSSRRRRSPRPAVARRSRPRDGL